MSQKHRNSTSRTIGNLAALGFAAIALLLTPACTTNEDITPPPGEGGAATGIGGYTDGTSTGGGGGGTSTVDPECTESMPVACQATAELAAQCWPPGTACNTIVACANYAGYCTSSDHAVDCLKQVCAPSASCDVFTYDDSCSRCMRSKCCRVVADCAAEASCIGCITSGCQAIPTTYYDYLTCSRDFCDGCAGS